MSINQRARPKIQLSAALRFAVLRSCFLLSDGCCFLHIYEFLYLFVCVRERAPPIAAHLQANNGGIANGKRPGDKNGVGLPTNGIPIYSTAAPLNPYIMQQMPSFMPAVSCMQTLKKRAQPKTTKFLQSLARCRRECERRHFAVDRQIGRHRCCCKISSNTDSHFHLIALPSIRFYSSSLLCSFKFSLPLVFSLFFFFTRAPSRLEQKVSRLRQQL